MNDPKSVKIFRFGNTVFLLLISLLCIIPFYFVISGSLVTEKELLKSGGYVIFPEIISFEAYKMFFEGNSKIWSAYGISILRVCLGTLLNIIFTSGLAYVMSKKYLPGRNTFLFFIFITMVFSGGLIPSYVLTVTLGLRNTIWSMILPGLINTWYMIILKSYFQQLPDSIEESARIDGANDIVILFKIVIPMSIPSIATIGLFYAVIHWNSWFDAAIYIDNKNLKPIQLFLRDIVINNQLENINPQARASLYDTGVRRAPSQALKNATILLITIPILLVYPFIQKYFVKGVMIGSIKG